MGFGYGAGVEMERLSGIDTAAGDIRWEWRVHSLLGHLLADVGGDAIQSMRPDCGLFAEGYER